MNKITLNRADIELVQKVLDEFPEVQVFDIIRHSESGIGYCVDVEFQHKLNDRFVTTRIEVAGVENW